MQGVVHWLAICQILEDVYVMDAVGSKKLLHLHADSKQMDITDLYVIIVDETELVDETII